MPDDLKRKAAVILAVTDRIVNGDTAHPSGYWGVGPMEDAHALDAMTKSLDAKALDKVLDRLTGEVA
jgi:hypothetical protein